MWEEVMQQDLVATDDEILLEIQTNPPPFMRAQPVFQTDSVFDPDKYLAALADPNLDFSFLESYIRATLPLQKLQEYMLATVRVTDAEGRYIADMLQDQVTISFVRVSPLGDVREDMPEPTDAELASFFAEHQEDFRIPEKRTFRYIKIPKRPSADDERYAREKVEEAFDAIDAGDTFREIAAEYSDDQRSGPSGGDLGWVGQGRLPATLDSVAFSLDIGQMSDIIRTSDGFHILRPEEMRETEGTEERRLSYILVRLEPSPLTIEQIQKDAQDLAARVKRNGIDESAAEEAYEVVQSPGVGYVQTPGLFRIYEVDADEMFATPEGASCGPIEGVDGFYIFEVANIVPSSIPPLEEISDRVNQSYDYRQREQRARAIADQVAAEIAQGKTLEAAASQAGLEVIQTEPFTRMSNVPGVGRENPVTANAFVLDEGQTSGRIDHGGQFYVIRVDEKQDPSPDEYAQNLQGIKASLLQTKRQAFLNTWYEDIRQEADVQDYRSYETGY
jgi:peptidyl-prolyl cis-trans isomerase D